MPAGRFLGGPEEFRRCLRENPKRLGLRFKGFAEQDFRPAPGLGRKGAIAAHQRQKSRALRFRNPVASGLVEPCPQRVIVGGVDGPFLPIIELPGVEAGR